jgi:hypothetical protein
MIDWWMNFLCHKKFVFPPQQKIPSFLSFKNYYHTITTFFFALGVISRL